MENDATVSRHEKVRSLSSSRVQSLDHIREDIPLCYSVLMTVYEKDNPDWFRTSLESIQNQTARPAEIVIVCDGPIPSTIQSIIDECSSVNPKLIKQINLPKNVGLGLALNEGLKSCSHELIARMDADDISLNTRCEEQLQEFSADDNLDILGTYVREFADDPEIGLGERRVPLENDDIYRFSKRRDPFNHPSVMYKKSKVMKYGPYGDYRKNQDTDLWIKMLSNGCKGKNIGKALLLFRFDERTYVKRKNWLNTKLLIKIRWNAYRIGFSSLLDFMIVCILQLSVYILPISFQKFVYEKLLRRV